ncbi:MAG: D-alanyl-D-alanine carboxypeptidase family protein [Acutalibacteraceae bacterium]|nr:D-alanyl-D-alanine carboxypeptidase family protein [Acutalibacteraceae bacterium]
MFRRILSVVMVLPIFLYVLEFECFAVSASSYVLYDPLLDEIYSGVDYNVKRSMASTTKIMTGLLLCENADLEKEITITDDMLKVEGTSIGIRSGDTIKYENLLYGLLLESGNDAANAIAISLCGSYCSFAAMMNKRASEIGMTNTNFVTPSGLDDDDHYTTAYDMALLAAVAMENDLFKKVVSSKTYKSVYNNEGTVVTYYNHNKLLGTYEGICGIKTGFTKKSGRCLVSACERNGRMLIVVTLNAPDDWNDHRSLYDYGYSLFDTFTLGGDEIYTECIVGGSIDAISVVSTSEDVYLNTKIADKLERKIMLSQFTYAPVHCRDEVGKVCYTYNNVLIAELPLIANQSVGVKSAQIKEENKMLKIFKDILSIK